MPATVTAAKTDKQIQLDVLAEIDRDWRFKPAEIGVEVDDGVVTLTGTVSSYAKLLDAADIAARVAGVQDVANDLIVQLAPAYARDDTAIAKQVRTALEWATNVPDQKIDSIVRNGIVTLAGTVDHWYEKQAAADAIAKIAGVVSVRNDLKVVPSRRTDREILDEIRGALGRRMPWLKDTVDLTVTDAAVTLMGTAPAYADRIEAEDVAWTARGVNSVTNKVVVKW